MRYEFAILDPWFAPGCYMMLPLMFEIPFALYTFSTPWFNIIAKLPRLPSFNPFLCTEDSDEMTFQQRLTTFLMECLSYLRYSLSYEKATSYAKKYVDPNLEISYTDLLRQGKSLVSGGRPFAELSVRSHAEFSQHRQHWRQNKTRETIV